MNDSNENNRTVNEQCSKCKFLSKCRFSDENTSNSCKFFIESDPTPTDKKTTAEINPNYAEEILRRCAKIKADVGRYNFKNHTLVTTKQALRAMEDYAHLRFTELLSKAGEQLPDIGENYINSPFAKQYDEFEIANPDIASRISFFEGLKVMKEKASAIIAGKEQEHKQQIQEKERDIEGLMEELKQTKNYMNLLYKAACSLELCTSGQKMQLEFKQEIEAIISNH